jgi:hypothetical protein
MAIKKALDGPMQTAIIRLPPEMLEALKQATQANGRGERGLGEEIRSRLEDTLAADKSSVESRYLGAAITNIGQLVTEYFGSWSQDAFAHQVLLSAIQTLLETMQPAGNAKPKLNPNSIADVLFDPKDGPDKIGRSLAGIALATTQNIRSAK